MLCRVGQSGGAGGRLWDLGSPEDRGALATTTALPGKAARLAPAPTPGAAGRGPLPPRRQRLAGGREGAGRGSIIAGLGVGARRGAALGSGGRGDPLPARSSRRRWPPRSCARERRPGASPRAQTGAWRWVSAPGRESAVAPATQNPGGASPLYRPGIRPSKRIPRGHLTTRARIRICKHPRTDVNVDV